MPEMPESSETPATTPDATPAAALPWRSRRGFAGTAPILRTTGALLRGGVQRVRAGGARLIALILVTQALILLVAFPVFSWIFREALRSAGMHGLDMAQLQLGNGLTLTLALIVVIITLAFWLVALQFTALIVLLSSPQLTLRGFIRELGRAARKLLRPRSFSLVAYLFLLLPLTGFGFASSFTQGIAIPSFISGELAKQQSTEVGFTIFLLALALLNLRLALTVPVFVLTDERPGRLSRRLTRGLRSSVPLAFAIAVVTIGATLAALALLITAVIPTALTDALAPGASHVVAAYSLGIAQTVGFVLSGLVTAVIAGVLVTAVRMSGVVATGEAATDQATGRAQSRTKSRKLAWGVAAACTAAALAIGTASLDTLAQLSAAPNTLVMAHRGFSDGGVENTIEGLEAAAAAGSDLVEIDVMQTRDGKFAVMHDANLSRLAGLPESVKDLTLDELTQITVRDRNGHEGLIPSLDAYINRANELDMQLLIEIKIGGGETSDHVALLIAELEALDALNDHIYHSLDAPSVKDFKLLRPDTTVGYTMAFAAVEAPETPADFIVVEAWSATTGIQRSAYDAGLGFMVWTVNDEPGMREHLRRNTDAIISDHPDAALKLRSEMHDETGLADVLVDTISRFVTIV